jgi:hypothetical protein
VHDGWVLRTILYRAVRAEPVFVRAANVIIPREAVGQDMRILVSVRGEASANVKKTARRFRPDAGYRGSGESPAPATTGHVDLDVVLEFAVPIAEVREEAALGWS